MSNLVHSAVCRGRFYCHHCSYTNHRAGRPPMGSKVSSHAGWMTLQSSRLTELHRRTTRSRVAIDRVQVSILYRVELATTGGWGG